MTKDLVKEGQFPLSICANQPVTMKKHQMCVCGENSSPAEDSIKPNDAQVIERVSIHLLFHFFKVTCYPVCIDELECAEYPTPVAVSGTSVTSTLTANSATRARSHPPDKDGDGMFTKQDAVFTSDVETAFNKMLRQSRIVLGYEHLKKKRPCTFGRTILRHVVSMLAVCFFVLNILRYGLLLLNQRNNESLFVVTLIYVLAWIAQIIVFTFISIGLQQRLSLLVANIGSYEKEFSYCSEVGDFNKLMKTIIIFYYIGVPAMSIGYVLTCFLYFPESKMHLTPLTQAEGVTLILTISCFSFAFIAALMSALAPVSSMFFMTILLRKELLCVTQSMCHLLVLFPMHCTQTDPRQSQSNANINNKTTSSASSTDESKHELQKHCHERVEIKRLGLFRKANLRRKRATFTARPESSRSNKVNTICENIHSGNENRNTALAKNAPTTPHCCSSPLSPPTFIHVDEAQATPNVSTAMISNSPDLETMTSQCQRIISLETTYDLIERRHAALCSLVACVSGTFCHVIPIFIASAMAALCFAVYSYSGGSLQSGHLFMASLLLLIEQFIAAFITAFSCSVHEAAKAMLPVLFNADKSRMSPTFLQKVQLTIQRLTTGEMGYSVYGFFVITRPTILMLCGTILTYTVVVMQFQMGTNTCTTNTTTV